MKRGMEWYKRDPRAMIDAKRAANRGAGMTVRQAAIYDLVTDLLYEGAGETPNNPQHIAGHFEDIGTRAARETITALIEMGKLDDQNGMLVNQRASEQAQARSEISEKRAESGRKGGENSAETRRKLGGMSAETQRKRAVSDRSTDVVCNKNNDITEANASSKNQAEKRREEKKIDDDARARLREADPPENDTATEREMLLKAMGVDPMSGIIGPDGRMIGRIADMQEYRRWRDDLGLSLSEVLDVVTEIITRKRDGPPRSFSYFTEPMREHAGNKRKPKLVPIDGDQSHGHHGNRVTQHPQSGGGDGKSRAIAGTVAGFQRAIHRIEGGNGEDADGG